MAHADDERTANADMAAALLEAARRLGSPTDAQFARLLTAEGAAVTENQVYHWRRGETIVPAYVLLLAAKAATAGVDELIAAATHQPGALAIRMDAVERARVRPGDQAPGSGRDP